MRICSVAEHALCVRVLVACKIVGMATGWCDAATTIDDYLRHIQIATARKENLWVLPRLRQVFP
jgi:hypothetical protein